MISFIENPLVTIGIPTYNRANSYLKETIESAIHQTYQNLEIIISDNCSQDNTDALVSSFEHPKIRYYKQEKNIGSNNNFNFCLHKAKGDYFLLLHSDDLLDDDFIAGCMRAANYRTDIGIIRTGVRVIDHKGNILGEHLNSVVSLSTDKFIEAWLDYQTLFCFCSTLYNTRRLREIGGFFTKHNLFQDVMAGLQLARDFGRIDVEEIKASFRKHSQNITFSAKVSAWCEDSLELLGLLDDLVSDDCKATILKKGRRFFSKHNYKMASEVRSPLKRLISYFIVFKSFDYRHIPPPIVRRLKRVFKMK